MTLRNIIKRVKKISGNGIGTFICSLYSFFCGFYSINNKVFITNFRTGPIHELFFYEFFERNHFKNFVDGWGVIGGIYEVIIGMAFFIWFLRELLIQSRSKKIFWEVEIIAFYLGILCLSETIVLFFCFPSTKLTIIYSVCVFVGLTAIFYFWKKANFKKFSMYSLILGVLGLVFSYILISVSG